MHLIFAQAMLSENILTSKYSRFTVVCVAVVELNMKGYIILYQSQCVHCAYTYCTCTCTCIIDKLERVLQLLICDYIFLSNLVLLICVPLLHGCLFSPYPYFLYGIPWFAFGAIESLPPYCSFYPIRSLIVERQPLCSLPHPAPNTRRKLSPVELTRQRER